MSTDLQSEGSWVEELATLFRPSLAYLSFGKVSVSIDIKRPLPYTNEVSRYRDNTAYSHFQMKYQTDLLISDEYDDGTWIPRVVIECKFGGVSTHDALTYSAKASTHKHVHPYLRYGILVGDNKVNLSSKLARHGAFFDFMMVWKSGKPTQREWESFSEIVKDEVRASRELQEFLADRKTRKKQFTFLHRPLKLG